MRELLIGSGNAKKLRELAELLADLPVRVRSLKDLEPVPPEPVEDGATFAENAAKKARGYAAATGLWTLADDSGLVVDALDGAPGVFSARYAGPEATDAQNLALVLERMAQVPTEQRGAHFQCALALATPGGELLYEGEGRVTGHLLEREEGAGGFGYDPIFIAEGASRSFGLMTPAEKAALSHRGRALRAFREALPEILARVEEQ